MTEQFATRKLSRMRKGLLLVAAALLALGAALLSFGPTVHRDKRPTAQDIALARGLIDQVKAAQAAGEPVDLDLDNRELKALSALATDAAGHRKVAAEVSDGVFTARASLPLVAGLWFNASATIAGTHEAFPEFRLKLGHVPLPPALSRWSADLARWWLARKGVELPELDRTVRGFEVGVNTVSTRLSLPRSTGLVGHMVSAAGEPVDAELVTRIYCGLGAAKAEPPADLTALVRHAFREASEAEPAEYNRAAFVALALYVVGERADPLAPGPGDARARCRAPTAPVVLRERADLAQHWTFSAALTAVLGEQTASNLGEWKELHDSLPAGSGFSFVDLAADRSGVHVARSAVAPETARATALSLKRVSERDLLPETLVDAPEGLSEVDFSQRFGGIEAERYRRAVAWIDRQLAVASSR